MKKLIVLTFVVLSTFALSAQKQSYTTRDVKPLKGPIIQFKESNHDFGTIDEGIKATYEFEFTNKGDSDLLLMTVQASCGCTVPTWPRKPIKPGEKGIISVVFNSSGRAGENFHKSITVSTNMLQDNVRIIYIKGIVARKITPEPDQTTPPNSISR